MKRRMSITLTVFVVLIALLTLFACSKVKFKVNFVVEGEVYHTVNTNGEETVKIPEDPIKDGYTFGGWYWDKDAWQKPFSINSLLDAPLSSDMNVYAKWNCIHTPSDWIEDKKPTCEESGSKHRLCTKCNATLETETIPTLAHDIETHSAKAPTCTEIGWDEYETCKRVGCNYTTYVEKSALEHDKETHGAKAPTCTEIGWDEYETCKRVGCNYTTYAEKSALEHDIINHNAKAPTCTEIGWDAYETCDREGCNHSTYVEKKAKGHSYTSIVTAPDCTNKGYTTHTCACGDSYVDTYVNALGHTEVTDKAVAPTCTETGLTEGKHCSVCDEILVTQTVVSAKGHTYAHHVTKPTCTEKGYTTHTCACGDSYVDTYVNALGHTEVTDKAVAPTCTETGLTEGKHCSVCGTVTVAQTVVSAKGHSYTSIVTAPDCTNKGYTTHTCACGDSYVDAYVNALGHTEVTDKAVAPTCTETGLTEGKHCSVCGTVTVAQTVVSAKGHSFGEWYETKAPTEAESGEKRRDCNNCTHYETDVVAPLSHEHSRWEKITLDAVAPTCTETGLTEGKKCSGCGEILVAQEVVPAKGHSYTSIVTAPDCTNKGYTTHTCACGDSYVDTYVNALGHTEVTDKAVAPTCTETGLTEGKHCSVCNATLTAQEIVPAMGHDKETHGAKTPTCTEIGWDEYETCKRAGCNYTTYAEKSANGHTEGVAVEENCVESTCIANGSYESVVYCSVCDAELSRETLTLQISDTHNNVISGECSSCGIKESTAGLEFALNEDGKSYTVTGVGTCTESHIVIGIYNNLSVTAIGTSAFRGYTKLVSVSISDRVTSIGNYAFRDCTSLVDIFIPKGVTTFGSQVLRDCKKLVNITVDEDNIAYKSVDGALYSKDGTLFIVYPPAKTQTSLTILEGATQISPYAFYRNTKIESIIIPDGLTMLGSYAFYDCINLKSVYIPESVRTIRERTFYNCTKLADVYYAGTETEWASVSISATGNAPLDSVAIYYYNEESPTVEGNFWHYVDGVITKWAPYHAHSYNSVKTNVTCTENGYTTHTCSCGDSYVDSIIDALGHLDSNKDHICERGCGDNVGTHADCSTDFDTLCDYGCGATLGEFYVTYEMFGAVGDGVANDFAAIYDAHDYANKNGYAVKANDGATYRITDTGKKRIFIATDVYWGSAKFIIDDKDLTPKDATPIHDRHIFLVNPETAAIKVSSDVIASINKQIAAGTLTVGRNSTKLDVGLGYSAMLLVENSERKVYIRYGSNANAGNPQQELILVDENGNIDQSTSFLLDYDKVTDITVYSINDTPLTIDGGIFTTIAPDYNIKTGISDYFDRGIDIRRSNVTLKNVIHYVENQKEYNTTTNPGWDPVPYHGFYSFSYANNARIENCVMTARSGHGTYDFSLSRCNNFTAVNCTMTNFFIDGDENKPSVKYGYWGVMGSSYCKNVTFDTCELSRFDAHAGLYNGKIINCKVSLINLIGGGEMLIQNTEIFYHRIVELRTDYGATWRGDIKIYDCKFHHNNGTRAYVFTAVWANHDFGYTTYFPNVEIRDLQQTGKDKKSNIYFIRLENIADTDTKQGIGEADDIHLPTLSSGVANKNPMVPPEYIKLISNKYNVKFIFDKPDFFAETDITGFP